MSTATKVYRNVRGLRTAIKDVGRFREILSVLVRHGFGAIVQRLRVPETVGLSNLDAPADKARQDLSRGQRIRMALEELGPTFVKLGQILSTRPDLVPSDIVEQLQFLQDDVPPISWEDVCSQVHSELGKPIDELFGEIDQNPLASASMAQVHRGRLTTGEEVVIKVQRPNLSQRIESDLNILSFLAVQAESLIPELKLIAPVGIVQEFDRAIRKELNFSFERQSIERFQRNFKDFDGVHIPIVYPALSAPGVLTMEFIDGVKITQAQKVLNADPYKLAPVIIRALFKMILTDGFFHGDLHPGNILITQDQQIAFIDFGLVGRLLPHQRERVTTLLLGIHREDYEQVARTLFDMGVKGSGVSYDYVAFETDVVEIMDKHLAGKTLAEIEVNQFFADLVSGAIRHQLSMPPTYTMVFKAFMTVEGIGKTLVPDINLLDELRPFAQEVLVQRYSPRRLLRESIEMLGSTSRFIRQFSQSAPQLLRDIEQGRLTINVEHPQLDRFLEQHHRTQRHLTRAILTGCVLICGTVGLSYPQPQLMDVPLFSAGAYAVGLTISLPLLLSLFKLP